MTHLSLTAVRSGVCHYHLDSRPGITSSNMPKKVAVIGAGPSGLGTLRHLSKFPTDFIPVGFEKNREVGGLWNYSDNTETDEYGLPCLSSLYKSLRTNLPKEVMNIPDLKFPEDPISFLHHTKVKIYLDTYSKTYDLNKYIKFQTFVTNVTPRKNDDGEVWLVSVRDLQTDEVSTDIYDAVIVCNGMEGVPLIPEFPGLKTFRGTVVHTKNHRDHEVFRGKTVMVVGSSYSAQDIIFDLGPLVPTMYVAHRFKQPLIFPVPDNVKEVPMIREVLPNGVILENGECREVDVIILATGYHFSFPFLSEECGLKIRDERITPLYNHMFNIEHPTLCFVGLIKGVLEFQISFTQGHFVTGVLRGDIKLPAKPEMYRREEEEYQQRIVAEGLHPKMIHDLCGKPMAEYIQKMAQESNEQLITPGAIKLFERFAWIVEYDYGNLKQKVFKLVGDDDFEEFN